jgi:hypothetical protein
MVGFSRIRVPLSITHSCEFARSGESLFLLLGLLYRLTVKLTLSITHIALILIAVVATGLAAGIFHDQSIKGVYSSFAAEKSQLESQTKLVLVHGTITAPGTPVRILFGAQSGASISAGVFCSTGQSAYCFDTHEYQVYLISGSIYAVILFYTESDLLTDTKGCPATPIVIRPQGTDSPIDFACSG